VGYGIAPQCARATKVLDMMNSLTNEHKQVPTGAQEILNKNDKKLEEKLKGKKRTNGSKRLRKAKKDRFKRWEK
jgi:hypothetical protein